MTTFINRPRLRSYMTTDYIVEQKLVNDPSGVSFPCPACGESKIDRSLHERKLCAKYTCSACGFEGPN